MIYPLVTVPILAHIDGTKLTLSILGPPIEEVTIPPDSATIVVSPKGEAKSFALQFLLPSGFAFEIPAIVPVLLAGPDMPNALGIAPTGPSTALLINTNDIPPGGETRLYDVNFRIQNAGGNLIDFVVDPTVVNNPIGTL